MPDFHISMKETWQRDYIVHGAKNKADALRILKEEWSAPIHVVESTHMQLTDRHFSTAKVKEV